MKRAIDRSLGHDSRKGRRRFRLIAVFLALALISAACGGSDDDEPAASSSDDAAASTSSDDASSDDTADAADTSAADADGCGDPAAVFADQLDLPADGLGGDIEVDVGAVLALTGPGSFYGETMGSALDLAAEQIAAAGGPTYNLIYHDHKSGDAQAGVDAVTSLGTAGVQIKFASYVDDLGAMFEGTAQYEMFTFDGGGGTSIFGQGLPYFWGTRAITPNDAVPGLLQYLTETQPDLKTIGLVGWDIGEPGNSIIREDLLAKFEAAGYEFNDLYELVPIGNLDYSAVFPKVKANEPDVLLLAIYGQDPGAFINQSVTAGVESEIIGFEFTPDGVEASKGVYDSEGYTFAYDFFDPETPTNPLAEFFVCSFNEKYGKNPDFYAANFYENSLDLWELMRRIIADGGDPTDPNQLEAALIADPTLVSIYGGDANGPGTFTLDLETHSVNARGMGVFRYQDGAVTPLAYFGIDALDFRMAEE